MMLDNQGFPYRQHDYNFIDYGNDSINLIWKTDPVIPATVETAFGVKFDEATHCTYLREQLKTVHIPGSRAARTIDFIKGCW